LFEYGLLLQNMRWCFFSLEGFTSGEMETQEVINIINKARLYITIDKINKGFFYFSS